MKKVRILRSGVRLRQERHLDNCSTGKVYLECVQHPRCVLGEVLEMNIVYGVADVETQ